MRRFRWVVLGVLGLLAAACGSAGDGVGAPTTSAAPTTTVATTTTADPRPISFLTGQRIENDVAKRPYLVVKIENSPQARPQTALDLADVVIEEEVEGGVTRFFVVFQSTMPGDAGPVRSGRYVDTELVTGFGKVGMVFSGARDDVLYAIQRTPAITVTEGGAGFYRQSGRYAPHNLYVDAKAALDEVVRLGAEPGRDLGWAFSATAPSGAVTCPPASTTCTDPGASMVVQMTDEWKTGWTYDAAAGLYRRDQDGKAFEVTGGGRIGAANVVVLATGRYYSGGYPESEAITGPEGAPAVILRDGKRYDAIWVKPTQEAPIALRTPDGRPFPLKPGPTWINLPALRNMPKVG